MLVATFLLCAAAASPSHAAEDPTGGDAAPAPGQAQSGAANPFADLGLEAHPSLTALCDEERVYGQKGEHAELRSFTSSLSAHDLVSYFSETLGDAGFTPTEHGGVWRLKGKTPNQSIVLDVLTVGTQLPVRCDSPLPEEARSVVLLSVLLRP
jgi:hypothetical protein